MPDRSRAVRTAVVGVGNMGAAHARQIAGGEIPGLELAAVCDTNPRRLQAFPDVPHFPDHHALLASGAAEAIVIATPHYDHTTIGIDALNAGLHVLVEKPISVHVADARRLIAAHRDPKQVFAAMFNQRTDPKYIRLKALIDSGELGAVRRVHWTITNWFRTHHYYNSGGWRATWAGEGGGVLLNQCPHQLDLWQWLFGMPERVRAFCAIARYHDIEVEDDVTAYLEYASGATGVFSTTTGEAPGVNRLEIAAENGLITVEGDAIRWTRNTVPMSEFSRTSAEPFAVPETERVVWEFNGSGPQHAGILANFADAIRAGAPLLAPAPEGIRSVELANAMLLSSAEERTLALPLDADAYAAHLRRLIDTSTFQKRRPAAEDAPADLSASVR